MYFLLKLVYDSIKMNYATVIKQFTGKIQVVGIHSSNV